MAESFTISNGLSFPSPGERCTIQNHTCVARCVDYCYFPCLTHRLAEIFISQNTSDLKEEVIANFVHKNTATRLVIYTEAFGMGLDCPDIAQVIHYRTPHTIDDYLRHVGRAGRSGKQARAILIPVQATGHTHRLMKEYARKGEGQALCRRVYLYKDYPNTTNKPDSLCRCCDICSTLCLCKDYVTLNKII